MRALVVGADLERRAGAGGGLLEDQRDVLALQVLGLGPGVLGGLQRLRQLQQEPQLARGEVDLLEEAAVLQVERPDSSAGNCRSMAQNAGSRSMRAGHAVAAAAALAELEALDGDHLDAGLAQRGVGAGVALVGDDDPGLERDDVVAVVPLLALGLEGSPPVSMTRILRTPRALAISSGSDPCYSSTTRLSARLAGPDRPGPRPADHLREQGDQVAVAHRDHGVEVHVAARLGQVHREHLRRRSGAEQRAGDEQHRLRGGALAHADHHGAVADRLDVPALDVARPQSWSAPPSQIGNFSAANIGWNR